MEEAKAKYNKVNCIHSNCSYGAEVSHVARFNSVRYTVLCIAETVTVGIGVQSLRRAIFNSAQKKGPQNDYVKIRKLPVKMEFSKTSFLQELDDLEHFVNFFLFMCGSNLPSYIPPSGDFTFFLFFW